MNSLLINGNYFFTVVFACESFIKMFAMGPRYFFAVSSWQRLDPECCSLAVALCAEKVGNSSTLHWLGVGIGLTRALVKPNPMTWHANTEYMTVFTWIGEDGLRFIHSLLRILIIPFAGWSQWFRFLDCSSLHRWTVGGRGQRTWHASILPSPQSFQTCKVMEVPQWHPPHNEDDSWQVLQYSITFCSYYCCTFNCKHFSVCRTWPLSSVSSYSSSLWWVCSSSGKTTPPMSAGWQNG